MIRVDLTVAVRLETDVNYNANEYVKYEQLIFKTFKPHKDHFKIFYIT